jgi:hypothetical protein
MTGEIFYLGANKTVPRNRNKNKGKLVSYHLKTLNLAKWHFKILSPSNVTIK